MADWHQLDEYDYTEEGHLSWQTPTTLFFDDGGAKHVLKVPALYGQPWYDSLWGQVYEAVTLSVHWGFGALFAASVLMVGFGIVLLLPRAFVHSRVRRTVNEVLACLSSGDLWGASLLVCSANDEESAGGSVEDGVRTSELARLSGSSAAESQGDPRTSLTLVGLSCRDRLLRCLRRQHRPGRQCGR